MLYEEAAVVALATADQAQVRAAGHLLASVLTDDVPVQLRLMVSQATGADGPYANLHAFSEALASFERPDPPALLRGLYRRAGTAPARAGTAMAPLASPLAVPRMGRAWVVAMWYPGTRFGGMSALSGVPSETAGEAPTLTSPAAAKR